MHLSGATLPKVKLTNLETRSIGFAVGGGRMPMMTLRATKTLVGLALAGAVLWPSNSLAQQCNTNCSVGALGTGGTRSDGRAQGFLYVGPGGTPGYDIRNSGNSDAGHIVADFNDELAGTLSGTYRDGICRGSETGFFGDNHGLDPDC